MRKTTIAILSAAVVSCASWAYAAEPSAVTSAAIATPPCATFGADGIAIRRASDCRGPSGKPEDPGHLRDLLRSRRVAAVDAILRRRLDGGLRRRLARHLSGPVAVRL